MSNNDSPLVGVIMGSQSDWPTLEKSTQTLSQFGIPWEAKVVSAHRTPDLLYQYAHSLPAEGSRFEMYHRGEQAELLAFEVPEMTASMTPPLSHDPSAWGACKIQNSKWRGLPCFRIVQMPAGIPTATFRCG